MADEVTPADHIKTLPRGLAQCKESLSVCTTRKGRCSKIRRSPNWPAFGISRSPNGVEKELNSCGPPHQVVRNRMRGEIEKDPREKHGRNSNRCEVCRNGDPTRRSTRPSKFWLTNRAPPHATCQYGAPFSPQTTSPFPTSAPTVTPLPCLPQRKQSYARFFLAPLLLPEAFLITPPPFNLHKCLPTGGFLQTAVSDAPRATSRAYLPADYGAHPIQH
jgi:hypothetical protein